jgi:hypothetical protein
MHHDFQRPLAGRELCETELLWWGSLFVRRTKAHHSPLDRETKSEIQRFEKSEDSAASNEHVAVRETW